MRQLLSMLRLGTVVVCCKAVIAYLDPGSGSLIIQILIAAIVGVLATFRFWKSRLLGLFGIQQDEDEQEESEVDGNID